MKTGKRHQIQQLSSKDTGRMRSLLNLFGVAFEQTDTYCSKQPDDAYLENLLNSRQFIALTAIQSKQVVGGLTAYELQKFEQQRSEIFVYDIAVDPDYRRRGIATKLIHTLKDIAAQRGVYVIFVQADQGDEPAIRLYEKLGQKEEVLHFDINVE